jgi:hypothetical protein
MEQPTRDRDLVRLHWSVELRPAFDALLDIDDAMAEAALTAISRHSARSSWRGGGRH